MKTKLSILIASLPLLGSADPAGPAGGYVAHEWGTFTSVQGADGIQQIWHPLETTELPGFVHGAKAARTSPSPYAKGVFEARQRMETPVIYFYAPAALAVMAAVDFPQGMITEWYPEAQSAASPGASGVKAKLFWNRVEVLPPGRSGDRGLAGLLPNDGTGNHYYAARQTDANALQVMTRQGGKETEKFLFYRGLGEFEAPLRVSLEGGGWNLRLSNQGTEMLRNLLVYEVHDGHATWQSVKPLAPGQSSLVPRKHDPSPGSLARAQAGACRHLCEALKAAGLYEREAEAMVRTWDDSWFAESGVRVLYLLPRAWTDEVLPLHLDPQPRELVRVMVGRAELITPQAEWQLLKEVVHYAEGDEADRRVAVERARKIGLGRFAEAAVRHLNATSLGATAFSVHAAAMLPSLTAAPADQPGALATK